MFFASKKIITALDLIDPQDSQICQTSSYLVSFHQDDTCRESITPLWRIQHGCKLEKTRKFWKSSKLENCRRYLLECSRNASYCVFVQLERLTLRCHKICTEEDIRPLACLRRLCRFSWDAYKDYRLYDSCAQFLMSFPQLEYLNLGSFSLFFTDPVSFALTLCILRTLCGRQHSQKR